MPAYVAIVGRPNVGKSTLFNRLSRSRHALVDDQPGVTRDRLYSSVHWGEHSLVVIDTGGFDESTNEPLIEGVRGQVMKAIEEADKIIFLVDGRDGLMPGDREMTDLLRRSQKRVYLAVNKIDGPEKEGLVSDFFSLGFEKVHPISAAHGFGVGSLMEEIVEGLPVLESQEKSSLVNRILGFERLLVSEIPGTTRDSVDTLLSLHGRAYMLIDTAGIRRKARVTEKIEKFSMIKALRSLDRCHIAVIVIDASEGVSDQDSRICGYAFEKNRGIVIAVNKWDLVKRDPEKKKNLERAFDLQLGFLSFAPRLNLSALTGEGAKNLLGKINLVYDEFSRKVETPAVNRALEEICKKKTPPRTGRLHTKLSYATQIGVRPPTFAIFANRPDTLHFSYHRFLINQFRERLDLGHVPIKLVFKKK